MLSHLSLRIPFLCFLLVLSGNLSTQATATETRTDLYQQLLELNETWAGRTPGFESLPVGWDSDTEVTLIQTHLQLVILQLETADLSHLSELQISQRTRHIQTLRDYMSGGQFPQNVYTSGRRPVFIDPWGTHCAVGHLIAMSGRPDLAETINEEHQLDFLKDIRTKGLAEWQINSGLSLDELALIQPSYHSVELQYPQEIEKLILGDPSEIYEMIRENKAYVRARCGGKTLLHFAAATGDLDLVKFLVENGADINALSVPGRKVTPPKQSQPGRPMIGVSSSSTLHKVQWNQDTKVSNTRGGGLRMGRYGRVFSTKLGTYVANAFNDLRGGTEGENALYFARLQKQSPYLIHSDKKTDEDKVLTELNKGRSEVTQWLKEQGLN